MSEKEAQYISIHIGLALGMSNKLFYCSQGLDNHCIFEICFDKRKPHKSQKSLAFTAAPTWRITLYQHVLIVCIHMEKRILKSKNGIKSFYTSIFY